MKIISFAWTTAALLAGQKTCTRRKWDDGYASNFWERDYIQAYDRSPRYGGKRVAVIQLTCKPYKEALCHVPDSDWYTEGFEYLTNIGAKVNGIAPQQLWEEWKRTKAKIWVIRFEVIKDGTQIQP